MTEIKMNGDGDTGNILLRIICLFMDNLMHDPKRACIILILIFFITMITGEFIGAARETVHTENGIRATAPAETGETYFDLKEIEDHGPVIF